LTDLLKINKLARFLTIVTFKNLLSLDACPAPDGGEGLSCGIKSEIFSDLSEIPQGEGEGDYSRTHPLPKARETPL